MATVTYTVYTLECSELASFAAPWPQSTLCIAAVSQSS